MTYILQQCMQAFAFHSNNLNNLDARCDGLHFFLDQHPSSVQAKMALTELLLVIIVHI